MQTQDGVLRHQQNKVPEVGIASLAQEDPTTVLDESKSKVHYIWDPYTDVILIGPDGINRRLGKGTSYYGVGRPGETVEEYLARGGDRLMRCVAYPVWNITYKESIYNMGKFTEEEARRGNAFRARIPTEDRQQYAGVCAADFISTYGEEHGARVLIPFIGMDDDEEATVKEILRLVQPKAYKLTNLREEEEGELQDHQTLLYDLQQNGPADERIRGAKLDSTLNRMAQEARKIMLGGVRTACNTARREWKDLVDQLSNSAMGHKGYLKNPSPHHHHLAQMLGEAVPAPVSSRPQAPASDPRLTQALETIAQIAGQQQAAMAQPDDLNEARQILEEIRAEKAAIIEERARLEALQAAAKKK